MNRPDQSRLGRNSEKESQEESVVNGHLDQRRAAPRVARLFYPWSERSCKKYRGLERGIGKGKSRPFDSSCLLDPGHLVCHTLWFVVRDLKRLIWMTCASYILWIEKKKKKLYIEISRLVFIIQIWEKSLVCFLVLGKNCIVIIYDMWCTNVCAFLIIGKNLRSILFHFVNDLLDSI